jgi:hypothetical protein
MTEIEAIAVVKEQFAGTSGFLARLQRGEGIDEMGVTQAKEALLTLKGAWADRSTIPKDAAFPLVDVLGTILSCMEKQPEGKNQIYYLAIEMDQLVDNVLLQEGESMSEERALAVVQFHFTEGESLGLMLHRGASVNQEIVQGTIVQELQMALDTLHQAWKTRQEVPKEVVRAMLPAPSFIGYNTRMPAELRPLLDTLSQDVKERIQRCLS